MSAGRRTARRGARGAMAASQNPCLLNHAREVRDRLIVDGRRLGLARLPGLRQVAAGYGLLPQPPPARAPARSAVVSGSAIGTTKGIVTINPTGNLGSAGRAITVSVRFAHDLYIF